MGRVWSYFMTCDVRIMLGEETGSIDQIPDSDLNISGFELNLTKQVLVFIVFVINFYCNCQCELQISLVSNCNQKFSKPICEQFQGALESIPPFVSSLCIIIICKQCTRCQQSKTINYYYYYFVSIVIPHSLILSYMLLAPGGGTDHRERTMSR